MRLTSRCEYALLALIFLARLEESGPVPLQAIASAQGIPVKFLEQIFMELKRAGFVRSTKGKRGGYVLARPAAKISLAQIVRTVDGPLAPTESVSKYFYQSTPIEREQGLVSLFGEIRNLVAKKMENTSLAAVSRKGKGGV